MFSDIFRYKSENSEKLGFNFFSAIEYIFFGFWKLFCTIVVETDVYVCKIFFRGKNFYEKFNVSS